MINGKVQAGISWVVIIAALGLGGNALYSANGLENIVLANEKDIFYEREIRVAAAAVLEEDLEELSEDLKELKQEQKEANKEIKNLLNTLILREIP